jgi:hypothetical protein
MFFVAYKTIHSPREISPRWAVVRFKSRMQRNAFLLRQGEQRARAVSRTEADLIEGARYVRLCREKKVYRDRLLDR